MIDYNKKAVALHKKNRGKIEVKAKVSLKTVQDLSIAYTPGVAQVCREIGKDKNKSWLMTNRANQVAIVSDGTAILGLGNLGPEAAMPVMEGKAIIFKEFAGIDAIPLCINSTEIEDIVNFCKFIEPSFGGINLEDIAAPSCFEILERLEKELSIPVFHDDQDGTAIVVLAALINACRVTGKVIKDLKIVLNGGGAAGIAITKLLLAQKIKDIILVDSHGIVFADRGGMNIYKSLISKKTNKGNLIGGLAEAVRGADVFIGVSKGNLLTKQMVESMKPEPIIFALANPTPEIFPAEAYSGGASIVGTGRSDFPNQVNNALVFPGLFRGLLDGRIRQVTIKMKIAAALAIAYSVKPNKNKILPSIFDQKVVKSIAKAIIANR